MPLTRQFFAEYQSFFWYGVFVLTLIGVITYNDNKNFDQMLDKPSLYLNYDGTFKSKRVRDLAQTKGEAFWLHQLFVINEKLSFKKQEKLLKDHEALRESISIGRNAQDAALEALLKDLAAEGDKLAELAVSNRIAELQLKRATEDLERTNQLRLQLSYIEDQHLNLLKLKTFVEGKLGK